MNRRDFLQLAGGIGVTLGWGLWPRAVWADGGHDALDRLFSPASEPSSSSWVAPAHPPAAPPPLTLLYDPEELLYEGPRVGFFAERPARVEAVVQRLAPLWHEGKIAMARPALATLRQIEAVHTVGYVAYLSAVTALPQTEFAFMHHKRVQMAEQFIPSGLPPLVAGRLSAGSGIAAVDLVMSGQSRASFSLGRPPGHHALPGWYKGFCIFNNAAVAARHAQRHWGVKRVMILDWDVHHGNGTQQIFYRDPTVLYLSLHEEGIYPFTGKVDEVGAGAGVGYNVNVPLPRFTGDGGYVRAFQQVVVPIAEQFRPDLIIVSAGQDAHEGEHLAHMRVSDQGFARMAEVAAQLAHRLCDDRLVLVLEGGYDPRILAAATESVVKVVAGLSRPAAELTPEPPPIDHLVDRHLEAVMVAQMPFWPLRKRQFRAAWQG